MASKRKKAKVKAKAKVKFEPRRKPAKGRKVVNRHEGVSEVRKPAVPRTDYRRMTMRTSMRKDEPTQ